MKNLKDCLEKLLKPHFIIFLFILLFAEILFANEPQIESEKIVNKKTGFTLTIKDDLISLSSNDASFNKILNELGNKLNIEIVSKISDKEKVTIEFKNLLLKEAIDRLSTNYGLLMNTGKGEKKVSKIFVLKKGKDVPKKEFPKPKPKETVKKEKSRPEPFKFEFNPAEFLDENK